MKKIDEREIAKKAEEMLTSSLKSKTQGFANHIKKKENESSIKDAFAVARVKKYGLIKNSTQKYFMKTLSIKMVRHGFIQHYGINSQRAAGIRTRTTPKKTTYGFKQHMMRMKAKPFLDAAIKNSKVVDFLGEKIAESRADIITDEIQIRLRDFS